MKFSGQRFQTFTFFFPLLESFPELDYPFHRQVTKIVCPPHSFCGDKIQKTILSLRVIISIPPV